MTGSFDTVLVANRGEIACRIFRTARRLGYKTVAVYSDADKNAAYVEIADAAVHIGPSPATDSYLCIPSIIAAAQETGAGAIHPGYGFLSENAVFADAVEKAGLVFVGPSSDSIRKMGLKNTAKEIMVEAGVPVVPGYHDLDQSNGRLSDAADKIGYPLLIKAVAGGGGRGMRRVDKKDAFEAALCSARDEATAAFGNSDVILEKLIETPRHIEVQVFGDGDTILHLFERDCSLQRRHQKIVEEAPAPGIDSEMREAMCKAAIAAAEAVRYRGAGTVEFIADATDGLRPDRFWFLEMNTRLQVEHPVTEAVTGVDLVEWQLRVAGGERLAVTQNDIVLKGHSIEARLYAEDVDMGFRPVSGQIEHLVFPSGVRVDCGVRRGDPISPFYDPLIAKLIAQGPTRDEALSKLASALMATEVAGVVTNAGFLTRLLNHESVLEGKTDTQLVERLLDSIAPEPEPSEAATAVAAVVALELTEKVPYRGFNLWGSLRTAVVLNEALIQIAVLRECAVVWLNDVPHHVEMREGIWHVDGEQTLLRAVLVAGEVHVFGDGGGRFTINDPLQRVERLDTGGDVNAPMPGRVADVVVGLGDMVEAGDALVRLEAMKMLHTLTAPIGGRVTELLVAPGAQVAQGALVVRLNTEDGVT